MRAVRTQARLHERMGTSHQQIRDFLIDRLLVNIQLSSAIRGEDDFFAVGSPVVGNVFAVVEGEALWLVDES